MSAAKPTGTALYYPNISVDENWLKVTLLYWDRMRRIVPREARRGDHSSIRRAIDSELLVDTPADEYREAASKRFEKQFLPLFDQRTPQAPQWANRLHSRVRETQRLQQIHWAKVSPVLRRKLARFSYLHQEKMVSSLAHELEQKGFASATADWLKIPEILAGLYMVCLGAEMSTKMRIPLVTDEPEFAPGGEYALYGSVPPSETWDQIRHVMLKLGLRFPKPDALATVPMAKIIRFHRDSTAERQQFREAVESVAEGASALNDLNSLADLFHDKKQTIQAAISSHRRRLAELGITTGMMAFLKLSIPSAITYLGGLQKLVDSSVLGVAGIALGGVAWWADYRGARERLIASSPWHYALKIEQRFSASS
jgi:hypothetical protein